MKKFLSLLLAAAMTVYAAGCGTTNSAPASASASEAGKIPRIGIVQLVEHSALDAAREGFIAGLAEAGYEDGKTMKLDYQNAQGEQANCVTIAEKLINDRCDLILAIATPAAQAAANKTTEIPILVTAVTDPASAKLVASNEKPGGNVTGTSDLNPIDKQMDLLLKLVPDAKTVAMLYCSSEANSEFQVGIAKKYLESKGVACIDATVSSSNEIQQVVQSLDGRADAIYTPTDNMISEAMTTVVSVANAIGIPTIVAEPEMVKRSGLATDGLDYFNLGKQTAAMAVKILKGEAKPADMPIEYLQNTQLFVNTDTAEALKLTIPQEIKDAATVIGK
ncbi:MAG: ABC transporter substrate-binding protein [Angelakisella sp.]